MEADGNATGPISDLLASQAVNVDVPLQEGLPGQEAFDGDPAEIRLALSTMYGIMVILIATQAALVWWKRKYKRSYELTTLVGLWLVPAVISARFLFWRFLLVWTAYSAITGSMLWRCIGRKRIERTTPRLVYGWFLGAHRVSIAVGAAGYLILVLDMTGITRAVGLGLSPALVIIWYGLYFGVLGRDCAEVAGSGMVASLGTGRKMAASSRECGICGGVLQDMRHLGEELAPGMEACQQLQCKHLFHERCIRGWTLVGKRDTCPVCQEKVDLRKLYADRPWTTGNLTWLQMLDAVRYMVVWNPLLFVAIHYILKVVKASSAL